MTVMSQLSVKEPQHEPMVVNDCKPNPYMSVYGSSFTQSSSIFALLVYQLAKQLVIANMYE